MLHLADGKLVDDVTSNDVRNDDVRNISSVEASAPRGETP
jgi:hypothetical protein